MAEYDLVIIGSGPGGYVAGIRAGQLGMKTAVIERDGVGGICLNWGCIPSKALLRNAEVLHLVNRSEEFGISVDNVRFDLGRAVDRSREVVGRLTRGIEALFKKNKVELVRGEGYLKDGHTVEVKKSGRTLSTTNVIVATGARPRSLPVLEVDRKRIITSREALELRDVPPSIAIIGAGATGAEFAYLYNAYGSEVTLVEVLPRLVPHEDEEISRQLERSFSKRGIRALTASQVTRAQVSDGKVTLEVSTPKKEEELSVDRVLVSVGAQGNVEEIGLERVGVEREEGYVKIGEHMETNMPGIYAIGDVTGKMALAHVASAQGIAAVEAMAGLENPPLDYTYMPRATYCQPQVASFGLTESQAREQGHNVKVGKFPFVASGKSLASAENEGLVKLVFNEETGEVLGAHMIGAEVTELLGEMSLTRFLEGTSLEVGWIVHPHPSLSEALKEAALAADGRAIHI